MGSDRETRQFIARVEMRQPLYWRIEFWSLYFIWLTADLDVVLVLRRAPHQDFWLNTLTPIFLFLITVLTAIRSVYDQGRLRRLISEDLEKPIIDQLEFLRLTRFTASAPLLGPIICFGAAAFAISAGYA